LHIHLVFSRFAESQHGCNVYIVANPLIFH
jgi:hypothetical protein